MFTLGYPYYQCDNVVSVTMDNPTHAYALTTSKNILNILNHWGINLTGKLGKYIIVQILYLARFNNTNEEQAEEYIPQIISKLSTNMYCYLFSHHIV